MQWSRAAALWAWAAAAPWVAGCVTEPAPIVIYEDKLDSVWLMFDPRASGAGHSHPVTIPPDRMAAILEGVRVADRSQIIGTVNRDETEWSPAFTPIQIRNLAPRLSEALRKASPKDLATFYLSIPDKDHGKVVTSGGAFVRDGRLYFRLANYRTMPSAKIYETTYEIDTRDSPLLPTARFQFALGFHPKEAWIPNDVLRGKDGYEWYMDESKQVIIDLARLSDRSPSAPVTIPSSR